MNTLSPHTRSLLGIYFATLLFALVAIGVKALALPGEVIVFGRVLFACISLLIFLKIKGSPIIIRSKKDVLALAGVGALLALHWYSFFESVLVSTVAIAELSFAVFPVFVTFTEPLFLGTRVKKREVISAIVVAFGVILMIPEYSLSNNISLGIFWGLVCALTFSIITPANRIFVKHHSSLQVACYEDGAAALWLLPFVCMANVVPTNSELLGLVVLGVVNTAIAHTLLIECMKEVKAQLASLIISSAPLLAIVLAYFIFGEVPSLRMVIGGTIILITTAFVIKSK